MTNIAPSEDAVNSKSPFSENLSTHENNETDVPAPFSLTIRYDTRCYFNVRSKADISQLNLPHTTEIYRTEMSRMLIFLFLDLQSLV